MTGNTNVTDSRIYEFGQCHRSSCTQMTSLHTILRINVMNVITRDDLIGSTVSAKLRNLFVYSFFFSWLPVCE